uniref:LRAT domain-containing protein n=1 Tax=Lynx canadensis TaxID=61383 RepID=A0A667J1U3_LYNCA
MSIGKGVGGSSGQATGPPLGSLLLPRKLPTPSWVFLLQFHGEPKPGDLIEILHIGYEHWAIYVGDGYVIHLTPPSDLLGASFSIICSVLSSKAVVRQELLRDVVGHCRYRVNNHLDHKYKPQPVKVIICSAKKKIGEEMEYRLLGKNCEHFVTDLRYGVPHSRQAEHTLIGGGVSLGLGILGMVGYSLVKT